MKAVLLAACVVALISGAAGAKEPATGITFSDTHSGGSLAGVGARFKGPLKIYAVGVYVQPTLCKVKLSKFKGKTSSTLGQEFFDALVVSGAAKSIVLKMAMGISKEKLASALSDSVRPRMGGDLDAVPKFAEAILSGFQAGGKASSGTELAFGLHGSSMSVTVNGKDCGTVKSAKLCSALMMCYFDTKSVSPALKKSCASGITGLL